MQLSRSIFRLRQQSFADRIAPTLLRLRAIYRFLKFPLSRYTKEILKHYYMDVGWWITMLNNKHATRAAEQKLVFLSFSNMMVLTSAG